MGAQTVSDIYRTGEANGTFRTAYYLTYYNDEVTIQGISGVFTIMCAKELTAFFVLRGVKVLKFSRVKNGRVRPIEVNTDDLLKRFFRDSRSR